MNHWEEAREKYESECSKVIDAKESRRRFVIEEKIGEKLFSSVCEQIENDKFVRQLIYEEIKEGNFFKNGKIDLVWYSSYDGFITRIIKEPYLINEDPHNFTIKEFIQSFQEGFMRWKTIQPYQIKHPECKGYEIVLDYTIFKYWKSPINIYIRKSL